MNDLISVIIPIYNVEKYLKLCIDSIINQTYHNLEIILVDDGSKDGCYKICEEYKIKDTRIRVIHKVNGGLSDARNAGIKVATGRYVAFIDADDYINKEMFEKLYNQLKLENAQIAICGYSLIDSKNREKKYNLSDKKFSKDRTVLFSMIGSKPEEKKDITIGMSVWKCLYDLNIIKNNNIYFQSERIYISEDIIFQIEYFEYVNKAALVEDSLYNYRYNESSLSKKYREERFIKLKVLYHKMREMINERGYLTEDVVNRLNRTFLMKVKSCIKSEILGNPQKKKIKIKNIKKILNDELVCDVLEKYPIKKMTFKNQIILLLMKFKMTRMFFLLLRFKR